MPKAYYHDPEEGITLQRLLVSGWSHKDTDGTRRLRVVLWRRPKMPLGHRFGTHIEVEIENGDRVLSSGHYDLAFLPAVQEFEQRCKLYECEEW